ncbi:MAG: transporter substrate-binding domain-containing protein [Clostridia bacterium]|nr:transporter substrate-binding domain-containing protein [Clostridia bacterium]
MASVKFKKIALAVTLAAVMCLCAFLSACTTTTKAKGLTLNVGSGSTVEATVGQKIGLEANVSARALLSYSGEVEWTSSDDEVASVQSGIVSALSVGTAKITATAGKYSDYCVVDVTEGVLKVGIKDDVEGFGYYDPYLGEYTGMEVDLAYMIADELGYSDVDFVVTQGNERIDFLDEGIVDCVIATFSLTMERMSLVDFITTPYYTDYIRVLTRDDYKKKTGIESVTEIPDYIKGEIDTKKSDERCVVGTMEGTTARDAFTEYCKDAEIDETYDDGVNMHEIFVYREFESYEDAAEALEAGEINLFMGDYSIIRNFRTKTTSFTDDSFGEQDYCVATKKSTVQDAEDGTVTGNSLHDEIEKLITRWEDDGTMEALLEKWGLSETAEGGENA